MLPPLEESVLTENPGFARLYTTLTTEILNADGSTRHDPAAEERDAISEQPAKLQDVTQIDDDVVHRQELNARQSSAAKQYILTQAIASTAPQDGNAGPGQAKRPEKGPSELSEPLLDLIMVLPPLLDPEQCLTPESLALLWSSPPLCDLDSLLPDLCALVSTNLRSSSLGLARVVHPTTNPSYLHRQVASLSTLHASLQDSLDSARETLVESRREVLAALVALLNIHANALTLLIRTLEAKHGHVSRNVELRASKVSLTAQETAAEAQHVVDDARRDVYSREAMAALRNYGAHLRDAKIRSTERIRGLEAELREYGVGVQGGENKERKMREMARVYKSMARQMADVKGDLDRLKDND